MADFPNSTKRKKKKTHRTSSALQKKVDFSRKDNDIVYLTISRGSHQIWTLPDGVWETVDGRYVADVTQPVRVPLYSSSNDGAGCLTDSNPGLDYHELANAARFRDGRDEEKHGIPRELYPHVIVMYSYCRALLLRRHLHRMDSVLDGKCQHEDDVTGFGKLVPRLSGPSKLPAHPTRSPKHADAEDFKRKTLNFYFGCSGDPWPYIIYRDNCYDFKKMLDWEDDSIDEVRSSGKSYKLGRLSGRLNDLINMPAEGEEPRRCPGVRLWSSKRIISSCFDLLPADERRSKYNGMNRLDVLKKRQLEGQYNSPLQYDELGVPYARHGKEMLPKLYSVSNAAGPTRGVGDDSPDVPYFHSNKNSNTRCRNNEESPPAWQYDDVVSLADKRRIWVIDTGASTNTQTREMASKKVNRFLQSTRFPVRLNSVNTISMSESSHVIKL